MNAARKGLMGRWHWFRAVLLVVAALTCARPQAALAETGVAPWSAPEAVATQLNHAARPATAYTTAGWSHAVWESRGGIYHAYQRPGEGWSAPESLATGMGPVMKVTKAGKLHVLYTNQFMGNFEVYHIYWNGIEWSLPVNVSRTTGYSALPVLTIGEDDSLHAAWMDNTPGYWTTYYGAWDGVFWSSAPVPSARGQAPAIAAAPDGTLYLAWQDRLINRETGKGVYEILASQMLNNQVWSLPINISDNAGIESIGPDVTTSRDNRAHITWVDDNRYVEYSYGAGGAWSMPMTAALAPTLAQGPRILAEHGSLLHLAWDESTRVMATTAMAGTAKWPAAELVTTASASLREVALATMPSRGVGISWVQQEPDPQKVSVYQSWRGPAFLPRMWMPMSFR